MNRMTLMNTGLFGLQILASAGGLMLLKRWLPTLNAAWQQHQSLVHPLTMVASGGLLYMLSFGLWMVILSRIELTVAYPVYVAATMLLTACGAVFFLGESMTALKVMGMVLVCAGITCLVAR